MRKLGMCPVLAVRRNFRWECKNNMYPQYLYTHVALLSDSPVLEEGGEAVAQETSLPHSKGDSYLIAVNFSLVNFYFTLLSDSLLFLAS